LLRLFPSPDPTRVGASGTGSAHILCHACQLGRHTRLPFNASSSHTTHIFQLIHCDLWTSPITSVSGHNFYLVILDDYSHYIWTFPLRLKSDTFSTISLFRLCAHPVRCHHPRSSVQQRPRVRQLQRPHILPLPRRPPTDVLSLHLTSERKS
jgi:hypothetical protein